MNESKSEMSMWMHQLKSKQLNTDLTGYFKDKNHESLLHIPIWRLFSLRTWNTRRTMMDNELMDNEFLLCHLCSVILLYVYLIFGTEQSYSQHSCTNYPCFPTVWPLWHKGTWDPGEKLIANMKNAEKSSPQSHTVVWECAALVLSSVYFPSCVLRIFIPSCNVMS